MRAYLAAFFHPPNILLDLRIDLSTVSWPNIWILARPHFDFKLSPPVLVPQNIKSISSMCLN